MENLAPDQVVLIAVIAGLVLLGAVIYFRSMQKRNNLGISLALAQQSEAQLQQQVQELKTSLEQTQQRINEQGDILNRTEQDNRALKIEQQKNSEMSEHKLKQFETGREQRKVEFENRWLKNL